MVSWEESIKYLKNYHSIQSISKIKVRALLNSFYETIIFLIAKLGIAHKRKKITGQIISLKNVYARIPNKLLANIIHQNIKIIIYQDEVEVALGAQVLFDIQISNDVINHINRIKKKNHMIISTSALKMLEKIKFHL